MPTRSASDEVATLTRTVLSPIAITVRDQAAPAVRADDIDRLGSICGEMLEANTADIPLASGEMKAVVASVVEGVLAALATSRAEVIGTTMHAIARFTATRDGADPNIVAAVICDAARVIEVPEADRDTYTDSMVETALSACDHLLGPDRAEFAAFLRTQLTGFLRDRNAGESGGMSPP